MIRMELCKHLNFNWIRLPAGVGMGTTGAGGRGPGAGNNIRLGGREGAAPASDAAPNGEAPAWVVVVGRGLQAIEDSIDSPLILV
jgi:hypothetical protein